MDPRDLSCFYIGKGKAERKFSHFKKHPVDKRKNADKMRVIEAIEAAGLRPQATVMGWFDTEEEAYEAEVRFISSYGLENLTNKNIGGAGGRSTKSTSTAKVNLSEKEETFCQLMVSGTMASASDCWRAAHPTSKASMKTQNEAAAREMKKPKIAARIAELRQPTIDKLNITLEGQQLKFQRAYDLAAQTDQPGAMTGAIDKQTRLAGLYPSDKLDVKVDSNELIVRLQQGRARVAEEKHK
jgi:hypothetical protein